jgi:hypothetical protein
MVRPCMGQNHTASRPWLATCSLESPVS